MSLATVAGRERFELATGNYQREKLAGFNPKSATLVKRKEGSSSIQICLESEPPAPQTTDKGIGVNLGRVDIAHTSLRNGCLAGRDAFKPGVNPCLSKVIVSRAKATKRAIALEDLRGIRERTNHQPRSTVGRFSSCGGFWSTRQQGRGEGCGGAACLPFPDLSAVFVAWRAGRETFPLCQARLWLGRGCRLQRSQCHCIVGGCCKPPTSPRLQGDGGRWLACQLQGYCLRRGPEALSLLRAA